MLFCCGCDEPAAGPPAIQTQNLHSRPSTLRVVDGTDGAVVEVRSDFGIGRAALQRTGPEWPAKVTVRLYLKALEGFSVSGGGETLDKESLAIDRNEADGQPCFDVRVPRSVLDAGPRIEVQWVDFYR
ncbi:hypothetical protein [Pirellulimonas nuda]|uniref:hypothetical protein n=1 Tax=Pirellulimonas nuda TaxID=2528009 RepID=UPI0011A2229B|nr:hypothetical protein [Pirellulimonas nuda]